MKVLVVDDDVVSRMMLMHLIDSSGHHEIVEAEDGAEAWALLSGGLRPAICFCDLRMPRLSGMELLHKVRADAALATLPFVLVSSANDRDTVEQATQAGSSGYIVKPFEPAQVRAHLDAVAARAQVLEAEDPAATQQRLGIDAERLGAYLAGFETQLLAADAELEALLGRGDMAAAGARVDRLRAGCVMLGLHGAAAVLAAQHVNGPAPAAPRGDDPALTAPPGTEPAPTAPHFTAAALAATLALVLDAVRRQAQRLRG